MTVQYVSSGVDFSGFVVSSGDELDVLSGGTSFETVVTSGGLVVVSSGGSTYIDSVSAGGREVVSGGFASGVSGDNVGGGTLEVAADGSAVVMIGLGTVLIDSGGTVSIVGIHTPYGTRAFDIPFRNGTVVVSSGGVGSSLALGGIEDFTLGDTLISVEEGSDQLFVSAGGVVNDLSLFIGDVLSNAGTVSGASLTDSVTYVESGGVLIGATANADGQTSSATLVNILSGGSASTTTINGGVKLEVLSGGQVSGTVVNSGGVGEIGGVAVGTTINSGGTAQVLSGGYASGTLVNGGGELDLNGLAANTTVNSGGKVKGGFGGSTQFATTVSSGGLVTLAQNDTLNDLTQYGGGSVQIGNGTVNGATLDGGMVSVFGGGLLENATLNSGSEVIAGGGGSGARLSGLVVNSGAVLAVDGTATESGVAFSGGEEDISFGYTVANVTLSPNGLALLDVETSGTASNVVVTSGAELLVNTGGSATGITVSRGGTLDLVRDSGAQATFSGGTLILTSGTGSGQVVKGSTVAMLVLSSAIESGTAVSTGGMLQVSSGGVASSTAVSSGGIQTVFSAGVARGTVVSNGGQELVSAGGADSATTVGSGGTLGVLSGGVAGGATLGSGGGEFINAGGADSAATLDANSLQIVYSGGLASGTSISAGGVQATFSSGTAVGAVVLSGGRQDVGGTASGTVVSAGGSQTVEGGGLTSFTVLSGGQEVVYGSGVASATTVGSGGTLGVLSGGVARGATVGNGGGEFISAGGVDSGATLDANSLQIVYSGGLASGTVISAGGVQATFSSGTAVGAMVLNGGRQDVGGMASGTVVSAGGSQTVESGGVTSFTVLSGGQEVVYGSGVASATTVGSGGDLVVSSGGTATGTVLLPGGELDLAAMPFAALGTAVLNPLNDVLTIVEGDHVYTEQLSGTYTGDVFRLAADGTGGTAVTLTAVVPCFCRGTRVATPKGEVAVEDLVEGDLVSTMLDGAGRARPVRWIGRRSYVGRFLAANPGVHPVRFRTGSLGPGLPRRDLLVSPDHAMFVDGVLVPARCLVNGTTIVRERGFKQVDYFHVELDMHDVLWAESAPSESFVDDDSRGMFHNAAEWDRLYPDRKRMPAVFCAPRVESGPELEAIRRRLAEVAGAVAQAA